ncbi:hypothetical protein DTO027B5_2993 [Paecilomyces variotii]|nr:hypothetical protein DTO027B3_6126 [Paecilomyces variotii]KAJ9335297.1 hypothetical protein DTO027B5_2993 [Paecilomyces variotii]
MSDSYVEVMSRHQAEASRLDQQFDLLTKNLSYLVHPEIAQRLPPNPRIADVGTGTGIFLHMLAPVYSSATLDGYDLSPALFYPPSSRPPNVNLSTLDARQPVPPALRGTYDLVHVRLIAAGLQPDEWSSVVQNLAQLLKPGGAMQWEECNFIGVQHYRGQPESTVAAARFMGRLFRDGLQTRFSHGWSTLPQDMKAAGLEQVQEDIVSSDRLPETRKALTANGMTAIFSWARLMASKGAPGALSSERLDELERQAEADIQSGCYVRFDIHVSWGFLPNK